MSGQTPKVRAPLTGNGPCHCHKPFPVRGALVFGVCPLVRHARAFACRWTCRRFDRCGCGLTHRGVECDARSKATTHRDQTRCVDDIVLVLAMCATYSAGYYASWSWWTVCIPPRASTRGCARLVISTGKTRCRRWEDLVKKIFLFLNLLRKV